jgi:hypothetical protein
MLALEGSGRPVVARIHETLTCMAMAAILPPARVDSIQVACVLNDQQSA